MSASSSTSLPIAHRSIVGSAGGADVRRQWSRRVFGMALAGSLALHVAMSFWPVDVTMAPDTPPLQATLTEMPAPPTPVADVPKPRPKPKRAAPKPAPIATPEPAPMAVEDAQTAEASPAGEDRGPIAEALAPIASSVHEPVPVPDAIAMEPRKQLPPRLDLAYKVFLGTQGFLIGEATYRFEHTGSEYRIATVGQARGLAALLIRGQGKIESNGQITPTGLRPRQFAVERGSSDRREVARFDWSAGIVTLHDQTTVALELPTFDPMALMWQFYFSPPVDDQQTFTVATTRRVDRYTVSREGTETIQWAHGEIVTERWHRRSNDGKTDGYVWLAPSLHYVPVKMRVVATNRGTVEALLDSIRADEALAQQ